LLRRVGRSTRDGIATSQIWALIASAILIERATMVNVGAANPPVGNTELLAIYRLETP